VQPAAGNWGLATETGSFAPNNGAGDDKAKDQGPGAKGSKFFEIY